VGACISGYFGSGNATCLNIGGFGVWGNISAACEEVFCSSATINSALWPANVQAGSSGSGICIVGTAGQPSALCSQSGSQGVWGSFTRSCSSCAPNTYQDQTGQPQCKWCPANSGSPPGSNSSSQCACLTGYTMVNATCQGKDPLISSHGSWRNQPLLIYFVQ